MNAPPYVRSKQAVTHVLFMESRDSYVIYIYRTNIVGGSFNIHITYAWICSPFFWFVCFISNTYIFIKYFPQWLCYRDQVLYPFCLIMKYQDNCWLSSHDEMFKLLLNCLCQWYVFMVCRRVRELIILTIVC